MPKQIHLGLFAQKMIDTALEALFDKIKARFLGPGAEKIYGKKMVFSPNSLLSMSGLIHAVSNLEGVDPREEVKRGLMKLAGSYIDAHKERAKAKVLNQVQSFLTDAQNNGVKTDFQTVLGGQIASVFGDVKKDLNRVFVTELSNASNVSILDAFTRIAAASGRPDPIVFFRCVHDEKNCVECKRLHLLPDQITPRVWKTSELGSGYHKKGDPTPKVAGLHPNCRCALSNLSPHYGFDASGRVTYKGHDWDELKNQRG